MRRIRDYSQPRRPIASCIVLILSLLVGIVCPVTAQFSPETQQIRNQLDVYPSGETGAWFMRLFAGVVADPALVEFADLALAEHSDELTPYQRAMFELLPYISQNADLLIPDIAARNPQRLAEFSSVVTSSPVYKAIIADGTRTLQDSAALQQRIGALSAALGSMTSEVPPTPAEICGGAEQSTLLASATYLGNDGSTSQVTGGVQNVVADPAFATFVQESGPALAAALQPQADLPMVDANGNPIPVLNWGKFFKGVGLIASAAVAVAVVVASGGTAAAVVVAVGAAVAPALLGAKEIVDAAQQSAGCPTDAAICSLQQPCTTGTCTGGCCALLVSSTSSALVRRKILACAINEDCPFNEFCHDGCCASISPD